MIVNLLESLTTIRDRIMLQIVERFWWMIADETSTSTSTRIRCSRAREARRLEEKKRSKAWIDRVEHQLVFGSIRLTEPSTFPVLINLWLLTGFFPPGRLIAHSLDHSSFFSEIIQCGFFGVKVKFLQMIPFEEWIDRFLRVDHLMARLTLSVYGLAIGSDEDNISDRFCCKAIKLVVSRFHLTSTHHNWVMAHRRIVSIKPITHQTKKNKTNQTMWLTE